MGTLNYRRTGNFGEIFIIIAVEIILRIYYSQNNYELIIAMLCMCVRANHVASVAYI